MSVAKGRAFECGRVPSQLEVGPCGEFEGVCGTGAAVGSSTSGPPAVADVANRWELHGTRGANRSGWVWFPLVCVGSGCGRWEGFGCVFGNSRELYCRSVRLIPGNTASASASGIL